MEEAKTKLKIWAKYSDSDGGVLEKAVPTVTDPRHERTLVIIKPDNFKFPNGRPGNILDIFSRTGLAITGIKVHRMSVAAGRGILRPGPRRAEEGAGRHDRRTREGPAHVGAQSTRHAEMQAKISDLLGPLAGEQQFNNIVRSL